MHAQHKLQSSTNVNINETQPHQRQQTPQPNLVKQQPHHPPSHPHQPQSQLTNMNKQPPIGAQLQNGTHPNPKAAHYYQSQQYQQQQQHHHQNRPPGQHPQLTGPPHPNIHNPNKPGMGPTNGTIKQQNQQSITTKNSFNSPNLNKTNG